MGPCSQSVPFEVRDCVHWHVHVGVDPGELYATLQRLHADAPHPLPKSTTICSFERPGSGLVAWIRSSLTFDMEIATINTPAARTHFETQVRSALADALQVVAEQVVIDRVYAGSVIVEWHLQVPFATADSYGVYTVQRMISSGMDLQVSINGTQYVAPAATMAPPSKTVVDTSEIAQGIAQSPARATMNVTHASNADEQQLDLGLVILIAAFVLLNAAGLAAAFCHRQTIRDHEQTARLKKEAFSVTSGKEALVEDVEMTGQEALETMQQDFEELRELKVEILPVRAAYGQVPGTHLGPTPDLRLDPQVLGLEVEDLDLAAKTAQVSQDGAQNHDTHEGAIQQCDEQRGATLVKDNAPKDAAQECGAPDDGTESEDDIQEEVAREDGAQEDGADDEQDHENLGPADDNDVWELFDEIDADGDGTLDPKEVRQLLVKLGIEKVDASSLQEVFSKMDPDGDGLVTRDEFFSWWKSEANEFKAKIEKLVVSLALPYRMHASVDTPLHLTLACGLLPGNLW